MPVAATTISPAILVRRCGRQACDRSFSARHAIAFTLLGRSEPEWRGEMPEIARRLTTILAADVAGYSRLAGADEEGTVSRLRALRQDLIDPVVAANGGRLV